MGPVKRLALCLAAAVAAVPLAVAGDPDFTVTGPVKVTEGDSLEMRMTGERIRLHGIDAPERAQDCERLDGERYRCGARATAKLQALLGINPIVGLPGPNAPEVHCEGTETDRYGRLIAKCFAGETEINRYMVVEGLAVADRRKSMDYAADEDAAKAAKRGIWAGRFVMPWDWRKGERLPAE